MCAATDCTDCTQPFRGHLVTTRHHAAADRPMLAASAMTTADPCAAADPSYYIVRELWKISVLCVGEPLAPTLTIL